jgi:plasmid stabilization system protein ParE
VEIGRYIAADRPEAAVRWVQALFASAASLAKQPRRGRKVPELDRPDLRQLQHGSHRLINRIDRKRIVILTVRHGRQGWDPQDIEAED